jgi:hypothetical protein
MITDISEMIQANFDVLRPTLTQADVFFLGRFEMGQEPICGP